MYTHIFTYVHMYVCMSVCGSKETLHNGNYTDAGYSSMYQCNHKILH